MVVVAFRNSAQRGRATSQNSAGSVASNPGLYEHVTAGISIQTQRLANMFGKPVP